jgi:putative endonuclease
MVTKQQTGRVGESLAANWLKEAGFTIIERNWRQSRYEIDIIACKKDTLHIIEVKTRRSRVLGYPETAVGPKKLRQLVDGADAYRQLNPGWKKLRFDVLSITLYVDRPPEFYWIEDVYW